MEVFNLFIVKVFAFVREFFFDLNVIAGVV